jgi:hypothetical protein
MFWTQVDPFLHLIEDNKLQVVTFSPDNLTINYGTKEDDNRALHTISELLTSEHQDREFFVSEIVKSFENMSKVMLLLVLYKCLYFGQYKKINFCISLHHKSVSA